MIKQIKHASYIFNLIYGAFSCYLYFLWIILQTDAVSYVFDVNNMKLSKRIVYYELV